jgi:biotin carboxylase
MNKYFAILGGNKLLKGIYDKLKSYGYTVVVVDWNEKPAVIGDIHIREDVKDSETILRIFKKQGYDIDGAISCIDLAAPSVSAINKAYGLKYMPEKYNVVLSKEQMAKDWKAAGIFNRISERSDIISIEEVVELNKEYRIIIKPDVAASSRGITTLEIGSSVEQIEETMNKAKEASFNKFCLIEEYVVGREFTVDMLGDDYGNVVVYGISVKYHTPYAGKNRCAVKLHWNSDVYSNEVYRTIAQRGRECYKAIGLKNCFGHLEMIMKEDGTLTPIEIGARTSGFIGSHLVSAASERDYLKEYVEMLHGKNIGNEDHINGTQSAMWYKYNIPAGYTCVKETSMAEFFDPQITVMYNDHGGLKEGETYGPIIDDNTCDMEGYEMIRGPKSVLTYDSIRKSEKLFLKEFCNYQDELAYED